MNIKHILISSLLALGSTAVWAQTTVIKGTVYDDKNEPLIGAAVTEVGNTKNGTIADLDGNFTLKVSNPNAKLRISYVGYENQEVSLKNKHEITISLTPNTQGLDEVVVVGYGTQKRITMTGAATTIKADVIKRLPVASVTNVLAGRLPGYFSVQRSGQPGSDAASFFVRGVNSLNGDNSPLIIVDDIEYSADQLSQISANEIESITILKDASTTAVYGLKGANGVLVIKTTRGESGRPTINFTAEGGFNQVIKMPTIMDAYTHASLYNEAQLNDAYGMSEQPALQFSAEDLELYRNGRDPYGHPNVDWVNTILAKRSPSQRYSIDVRGGNDLVKYFTTITYYSQGGMMKHYEPTLEGEDPDNNYYYKRYNFRSNLDFTPTKTTHFRVDLNGRFETQNEPKGSVKGSLFDEVKNYAILIPYAMPLTLPNGKPSYANHPGVDSSSPVNPISRYANSGYVRRYKNNFNVVLSIDQKLDFITKGLTAMALVSYAGNHNEWRQLMRTPGSLPGYIYDGNNDSYIARNGGSQKFPKYGLSNGIDADNYTINYRAQVNYDRTFSQIHHLYGLVLFNRQSYVNDNSSDKLPVNDQSITLRVGYDYRHRYMVEFNAARNGNDKFVGSQKFGWFPAVSLGWNISEEDFFKKLFPVFDLFKIRGTYGVVGSDKSYKTAMNTTDVIWGHGANAWGATSYEGALVYPNATWEKERKADVGIDINMLNSRLKFNIDFFRNVRYDQLITRGDVPAILGQTLPQQNVGKSSNSGFDGEISYRGQWGKVQWTLGGTYSYAKSKVDYISEAPDYPYQAQSGKQIGLQLGYRCLGFYQQEDFDANGKLKEGIAAPTWTTNLQPGDLRYADLSGDGIINEADRTYISKTSIPTFTYGINMGANWKGISVNLLWQGSSGYAIPNMGGNLIPFSNNIQEIMVDRWTPQNTDARFPRLGLTTWGNNNYNDHPSDFWYLNASYFRLRSLEVAYQLPQHLLHSLTGNVVKSVRVYMTGYNLLNFSNLNKLSMDPEAVNSNAYPTQASYMFGLQCAF